MLALLSYIVRGDKESEEKDPELKVDMVVRAHNSSTWVEAGGL